MEHDGYVDARACYTIDKLAAILNCEPRWIKSEFIDKGLRSFKVGKTRFISGDNFIRFIETNSEPELKEPEGCDAADSKSQPKSRSRS